MIKKSIKIESDFLHFPIQSGCAKNELQIYTGGVMLYQFSMELAKPSCINNHKHHYFFLNVSAFIGTLMELVVHSPTEDAGGLLDGVFNGSAPESLEEYKNLYNESLRPQFHFTSKRGWLNDPNGLFYHDGVYHMYYQHNPFGTLHGSVNISWGHAVSKDLIHWDEHKDAILPWRRDWMIASGSAVVDKKNSAGYGENAVIAAFTALGTIDEAGKPARSGGQFMAASVDGGENFFRFSQLPSICVPNGEGWRDPRLFEVDDCYYIAVYETRKNQIGKTDEEVDGVSFYKSSNLKDWVFMSWTANLYECPDIFKLGDRWVLFGADGIARLGDFADGFFEDSGIHLPLDYGTATYAGQTWSHAPDEKRLHISWIRGMGDDKNWENDMGYNEMPFSQCMSFPCEITLHNIDGRYHLCRAPIAEIESLRKDFGKKSSIAVTGEHILLLMPPKEMCLSVCSFIDRTLIIKFRDHKIILDLEKSEIQVDDKPTRVLMEDNPEIRILSDTTTLEIFIGNEVSATYAGDMAKEHICIQGDAVIELKEWELHSIWHAFTK